VRALGLVLAGGQSRRMGQDKLALPVSPNERQTVVMAVVAAVSQQVDVVRVIRPPLIEDVPLVDGRYGLGADRTGKTAKIETVYDASAHQGPLQALAGAWPEEADAWDCVLVAAGDIPGLSGRTLGACAEALMESTEADGVLCVYQGRPQPLVAAYRWRVGPIFQKLARQGEHRIQNALREVPCKMLDRPEFASNEWELRPIHTPEDYRAWLERREAGR
jgi:molybdopterin-guanine dinucleotide biosynthesis protein A